jgi:general L-amino acid transport system permease protein
VANTSMNQTGQAIEAIAILMAVYLSISLAISLFMNWYNARVRLVER